MIPTFSFVMFFIFILFYFYFIFPRHDAIHEITFMCTHDCVRVCVCE
jgi:hypothetical protein